VEVLEQGSNGQIPASKRKLKQVSAAGRRQRGRDDLALCHLERLVRHSAIQCQIADELGAPISLRDRVPARHDRVRLSARLALESGRAVERARARSP